MGDKRLEHPDKTQSLQSYVDEQIAQEALALPSEARALLADRLVESLDAAAANEIDRLWASEAKILNPTDHSLRCVLLPLDQARAPFPALLSATAWVLFTAANMKTISLPLSALVLSLTLTSCNRAPQNGEPAAPKPSQPRSASGSIPTKPPFEGGRKTTFQEVTSDLDPGGSLFLYLATDQWLARLSEKLSQIQEVVKALPNQARQQREQLERVFELLGRLVKASGVEDVTGVGASVAPVAPGLFRQKVLFHHVAGAGKGFAWSMFGRSPHALAGQDMLPANTALAAFADLDVNELWEVVERQLVESGIPEAAEAARSFPQMFEKQTQVPWKRLLESLGGEIGIALTLDETHHITIPAGPRTALDIPGPGLLVAIKVKNDLLYEQVSAKLEANPKTVTSEEGGLKLCSMPLPLPLPIALEPTVASSGDYFYFATSPDLVRLVQAVRKGKSPGLKSSKEFQELARLVPAQGNQFFYVSKSLGNVISGLQNQVMGESGLPEEERTTLSRLLDANGPGQSLAIGAHTPTGWQTTSVGNHDTPSALLLAPVGATAIGAGMLLPALAKAKSKAQTISSVNQVKQLGLAARMYSNDHNNKFPNAQSWCDDVKNYVGNPKVYKAPNDSGAGECSFAFNEKLSGLDEGKIDPRTVLFFETEAGWNRSGGPELMLAKPRSGNLFVVGFADGSVQQLSSSRLRSLKWDPSNGTQP